MDRKLSALDQIKACLDCGKHFVLQGGAGSGKTETLKEVLKYIAATSPEKNLVCITLTNKAADEIKKRVKSAYHISTIHSFLHQLIAPYNKDVQKVLARIFEIRPLVSAGASVDEVSHKEYKATYAKYTKLLYRFSGQTSVQLVPKRDYDKNVRSYVETLDVSIHQLNADIQKHVLSADYRNIKYNESPFNNVRELTHGHDGLLNLSATLLSENSLLQRILRDKFDYIFIDEYQDTSPDIIRALLNVALDETATTIGLFGDSMQGIYKDGIGDVDKYVLGGILNKIEKEDNFRCSEQVVRFLNRLRLDTLKQEVALKVESSGENENLSNRQGTVALYYSVCPDGGKKDKDSYSAKLKSLIRSTQKSDSKTLMLTNKSIATECGFPELFSIFNDRFEKDGAEQMKRVCSILQLDQLVELCSVFLKGDYNHVIAKAKDGGFTLTSQWDKLNLYNKLSSISRSKGSAVETLFEAYNEGLLKQSSAATHYFKRKEEFLKQIEADQALHDFAQDVAAGINTAKKMVEVGKAMDEYKFADLERALRKKVFYEALFSSRITFAEIFNYIEYLDDKRPFITMHKTKGTGIENVTVVLDEGFWNEYSFKNIFSDQLDPDQFKDRKLVYVACSRAIKNLTCVQIISAEEEAILLKAGFDEIHQVDYELL